MASIDTSQSSSSNRVKLYVNGTQITDFYSNSRPTQNQELRFNRTTDQISVGANGAFNSHFFSGYIAEVHFIDGQALSPTDFGEFDADTGAWNPIDCKDNLTYGTNGFFLKLDNNSSQAALGTDSSGQNNTFTVHNLDNVGGVPYSNDLTASGTGFALSSSAADAFDGSLSSSAYGPSGGNLTWAPSPAISYSTSVEVYPYQSAADRASLNGGALVSLNQNQWTTVATGSGTITSLVITDAAGNKPSIAGIRVDGTILVDGSPAINDSLIDTPTNYRASPNPGGNYCVLNPYHGEATLSNGNLDATAPSEWKGSAGTISMSSGKFYWEIDNVIGNELIVGIVRHTKENITWNTTYGYGSELGTFYPASGGSSYGAAWSTGDVIGIAFDADNGSLTFYKNGVSQGVAATGLTNGPYMPSVVINGSSRSCSVNFGQRDFLYTNAGTNRPAATYLTLCTENLPDPAIPNPSTAFTVLKWDGNGSNPRTLSGLPFSPDFAWLRNRNQNWAGSIFDQVRGGNEKLRTNHPMAETQNDVYGYLSAFTSDGFTVNTGQ